FITREKNIHRLHRLICVIRGWIGRELDRERARGEVPFTLSSFRGLATILRVVLPHAHARAHGIREDVVGYIPSYRLPRNIIKREVNSTVNPCSLLFVGHCAKTCIRPCGATRPGPRVLEPDIITPEKLREYCRLRSSNRRHVSCVRRIRRSTNQRRPRRIRSRISITVFVCAANRRDRPPQAMLKLSRKRGLQRVMQRNVCQCKQSR